MYGFALENADISIMSGLPQTKPSAFQGLSNPNSINWSFRTANQQNPDEKKKEKEAKQCKQRKSHKSNYFKWKNRDKNYKSNPK